MTGISAKASRPTLMAAPLAHETPAVGQLCQALHIGTRQADRTNGEELPAADAVRQQTA